MRHRPDPATSTPRGGFLFCICGALWLGRCDRRRVLHPPLWLAYAAAALAVVGCVIVAALAIGWMP